MTEDEAREKWCPFVRHTITDEPDFRPTNRHGSYHNPEYSRCIASDCMAWRKRLGTMWTDRNKGEPDPDPAIWSLLNGDEGICQWVTYEPIEGYCGLAGQDLS